MWLVACLSWRAGGLQLAAAATPSPLSPGPFHTRQPQAPLPRPAAGTHLRPQVPRARQRHDVCVARALGVVLRARVVAQLAGQP